MKTDKSRTITCILSKGVALEIVQKLEKKGLLTANLSFARGTSTKFEEWGGDGLEEEKDILSVVVPDSRGDEIFEYLYDIAAVDSPSSGSFLFMGEAIKSMPFVLPDVPPESSE